MPAHSRLLANNASTDAWIEIAQEVFDTLRIPALDPRLWDRTWELEILKEEMFTLNQRDEQFIEERLLQFFEQIGDKFYCRLPINHPNTGQSYCNHALGRKYRILGHLRAHLNFRPFVCGGDCGTPGCTERFCEDRYRLQHVKPDKRKCPHWYGPPFHFMVAGLRKEIIQRELAIQAESWGSSQKL